MIVVFRSAMTSNRSSRSNSIPDCASRGEVYSLVGGIMAIGSYRVINSFILLQHGNRCRTQG